MIIEAVFEKLEFQKIIRHISNYCVTETGKSEVLKIKPTSIHEK